MGTVIWQGLLTGICLSATYVLVTVGFSLFYRAAGVLNLAHGAVVMTVGMLLSIVTRSLPSWLAVPIGIVLGMALSLVLFVIFLRPVLGRGPWFLLFVTLGLSFVMEGAALALGGTDTRSLSPLFGGQVHVLGAVLRMQQVVTLVIATVVIVLVIWLTSYTMLGRAMRAAAEEPEGAAAVGIDPRRMMLIAALISGGLAGLAAALVVPDLGVAPETADSFTLIAVTAAVVGGLGRTWGAVVGGIALGLVNGLSSGLAPQWFEVFEFTLLILVLAYRSVRATSRNGGTRRTRRPGAVVAAAAVAADPSQLGEREVVKSHEATR